MVSYFFFRFLFTPSESGCVRLAGILQNRLMPRRFIFNDPVIAQRAKETGECFDNMGSRRI